MAKDPKTPKESKATPFQKFERLAKKLVSVSKDKIQPQKGNNQNPPLAS